MYTYAGLPTWSHAANASLFTELSELHDRLMTLADQWPQHQTKQAG